MCGAGGLGATCLPSSDAVLCVFVWVCSVVFLYVPLVHKWVFVHTPSSAYVSFIYCMFIMSCNTRDRANQLSSASVNKVIRAPGAAVEAALL